MQSTRCDRMIVTGYVIQRRASQAALLGQECAAVGACLCPVEDGEDSTNVSFIDRLLLCVEFAKCALVSRVGMFEGMQDGQAFLAPVDIACGSFTRLIAAGPDAQHIIAYLEGDAHRFAKAAQPPDSLRVACAEQCSHLGGAGH